MNTAIPATGREDAAARQHVIDGLLAGRRNLGLTQTEVGKRMGGVSQPTISEFESEPSDPRLSTVQRYARALGGRVHVELILPDPQPPAPSGAGTDQDSERREWAR